MTSPGDFVTLLCAISFVVFDVYALALWVYVLVRTRLAFAYVFVLEAVVALILAVINVVLYHDPYVGVRLLGRSGWKTFYYVFVCVQPMNALIDVVGLTILVFWISRTGLTRRCSESLAAPRSSFR
jgi:hypothetical protein